MCQEGRLSAYCNKDLEKMLKDALAEMPLEYYTNEEYSRLSKDGESVVDQPSSQEAAEFNIEVDVESGMHSVPAMPVSAPGMSDKAVELRRRMAAMEAELKALQQSLGPSPSSPPTSHVLQAQAPSHQPEQCWPSPNRPSPPLS
eukprot:2470270-Rhodomonas_salina.2